MCSSDLSDRNLAATVSGGLHASRDSLYRTARGERQRRTGVIPLEWLPRRCPVCRGAVQFAAATRSLAMDGAGASAMMTSTNPSGCGAEFASRAGRLSLFCPIGWRQPGTTAFTAGSGLASGSRLAILLNKLHHTARTQHACLIPQLCAGGRNGG